MVLLFDKECILRGIFSKKKELPLDGSSITLEFKDSYIETILNVNKAKFYKNYIYIRVSPYIEYFNKSIHINDKIEFTYKFNNEVKGEIENGL